VGLFELRLREVVPSLGPTSPEELHSIARKLAELAPDLGVTHCALSMVNFFDWNFPAALEHARQSVKADPDYEVGRLCFNYILTHWGRPIEGRKQAEIARKLAPSKATVYRSLGHTYYVQRDYTNAIALYRQAIGWQSHHTVAHYLIGRAYLAQGDYLQAISYFEQKAILDGRNEAEARTSYDALRRAVREGGARGYWQEEWKRTEKNVDGEFYRKAVAQIHLGDTNAAFAWLNRSYESREHYPGEFQRPLESLVFDEHWDGVRDDPRFQELLDKIGFTKVMRPR
jgi:tetratricopeptide (TPR) repeat protein